jgi:hypothetical protein
MHMRCLEPHLLLPQPQNLNVVVVVINNGSAATPGCRPMPAIRVVQPRGDGSGCMGYGWNCAAQRNEGWVGEWRKGVVFSCKLSWGEGDVFVA